MCTDNFPDPHFPTEVRAQRILFDTFDETTTVENIWACAPRTESEVLRVLSWAAECNYRLGEALAANGGSLAKATTTTPGGFIWWNVRPVGRQLSWAPLLVDNAAAAVPDLDEAQSKGYTRGVLLLHLQPHFCNVLAIDKHSQQMRVQGATPLTKLIIAAHEQGLTLHNYPGCGDITIAGVVATGGHGSNALQLPMTDTTTPMGSVCNAVVAMRVAVYDRLSRQYIARTFTRSDARTGAQFLALLVNLGSTLIFDLTLQLLPQYNLRCITTVYESASDYERLFARPPSIHPAIAADAVPPMPGAGTLAEIMNRNGMVSALTFPLARKIWLRDIFVCDESPAGGGSTALEGPFAYPYMHRANIGMTSFFECLLGTYPYRGFLTRFARGLSQKFCGAGLCTDPMEDTGTMTIYPMAAQLPAKVSTCEKCTSCVCDRGCGLLAAAKAPCCCSCTHCRAKCGSTLTVMAVAQKSFTVPEATCSCCCGAPDLADTWGPSHYVMLNVSPITMAMRSHGLYIITSRRYLQHVLHTVKTAVDEVTARHGAGCLGQYPEALPVEYRLSSLDNVFTTADGTTHTESAYLSFLRQDAQTRKYGWDIGVAVELVHFPHAFSADAWQADMERYLREQPLFVNSYVADAPAPGAGTTTTLRQQQGGSTAMSVAVDGRTPSARLVLPWSKAWGYTARDGAWHNDAIVRRNNDDIPHLRDAAETIANVADPYLVFTNGFMHFTLGTAAPDFAGLPAQAAALRDWAQPMLVHRPAGAATRGPNNAMGAGGGAMRQNWAMQ
jgi:hypothetical protein